MIPHFPNFKALEISDKKAVEHFTKQFEPYSDHYFTGVFCWDSDEEVKISNLNDNLVFELIDYLDRSKFYSFIGTNKVEDTIDKLLKLSNQENIKPLLRAVPEPVIDCIKNKVKYKIEEDRDNFDYILSVEDLIELKGYKFHPQKNFINRYKKEYESITKVEPLILSEETTKKMILDLFYDWEKSRGKTRSETEHELKAIKKLLAYENLLDFKALGLFINNELKGFSINEIVSNGYGVSHFEKVDVSLVGIFQYLRHEAALMFKENGTKYINIEQDLGIEGLRKAKLAHNPVKFLKKYTVERIK